MTAAGSDMACSNSDNLMAWLENKASSSPPKTEFPFTIPKKPSAFPVESIRRRGSPSVMEASEAPRVRGRFDQNYSPVIVGPSANQPKIDNTGFIKELSTRGLISPFTLDQTRVATKLGFINKAGEVLWKVDPEFHEGNRGKPKTPYMAVQDVLGHYVAHLLTGPAFDLATLEKDKNSFELHYDLSICNRAQIEHFVTDTLALTTEGDKQVLRPNGLQFSQAITVPSGGNINYNGGNEKHGFRSNTPRKYIDSSYKGLGGYSGAELNAIEEYDKDLLTDEERRLKRAGLLSSAYVTVSAEGGFGSTRQPLARSYRVLYMATAGAQFEKYGRGQFTYVDQKTDPNELEAADFIISTGALENNNPLFPHYYSADKIQAHATIQGQTTDITLLDSGDFTKDYVELLDKAFFNRKAFQTANDNYMLDLVIPNIVKRTQKQPFYLKAVLLGGGFFANTDKAGSLRSEVINTTLHSYIKAIEKNLFPAGSVIEFPRYGAESLMPAGLMDKLKQAAFTSGIELVWTPQGDICDFKSQRSLFGNDVDIATFEAKGCLVVLGAADVMSWHGNEPSSSSVESCFANNSNLRLVMNWWANSKVLKTIQEMP